MSIADDLQKLQQLHQSGAIDDEEFAAAKAKLLSGEPEVRSDPREAIPLSPAAQQRETRQWAFALHLSVLAGHAVPFAGLIVPILIWQLKKDELPGLDVHGKNAVNWIISAIIYAVISAILCLVGIGVLLLIALGIVGLIFPIIAGIKAIDGEAWKYPMAISFLK